MVNSLARRAFLQPVDKTFAEVVRVRAIGRASLYADVAWAAAKQYCALYNKSPSTVVKLVPFGNSFIDEGKGIFDDMCEPHSPPPSPPSSPFVGGQCVDVKYFVQVVVQTKYIEFGAIKERSLNGAAEVWGAVTGSFVSQIESYTQQGLTISGGRWGDISCRGSTFGSPGNANFAHAFGLSGSNERIQSISITSVQRSDGQADSCGNPPVSYPPPSATPDDLSGTTIINISPGVNATVPVVIIPTIVPVVGIFRPEFNVNVGGINVNITAGGFTFSPSVALPVGNSSPYFDPRLIPPAPVSIDSPSDSVSAPCDLTPVTDILVNISKKQQECCPPKPAADNDPLYINKTTSTNPLEAGSIVVPDGTYKVTLLMTVIPQNAKSQYGGGEADIYFAGSAWFSSGASLGVRCPIDAQFKQFIPYNELQNSFVWSYNVGYKGIATVYYREKKPV